MKNNPVMTEVEITPEVKKLVKESENMLTIYQDYKILSQPGYADAGDDLKKIKAKAKEIEEVRRSITRPMDEAKAKVIDFFRHPIELLNKAETIIKRAILTYQQDQERKRKEEETRLQEQARKEEEKRRKALEAKAEKAEAKGDTDKAEELKQQAEEVHVPVLIIPQLEKVEGIHTRKIWKYRIVDENKLPREYLMPNHKMLGEFAEATKGTIPVPGVEFYFSEIIAAGKK